ncbi:MAG TPA: GNVR domain-containing protein, partial [Saprospiraceae bacterium]|nr:GNVR domain-containing protein [Saprospiraceae bacterium]
LFFFTHDSLVDFTRQENEVLISLYHFIIGPPEDPSKALLVADYNEDTNIMSLTATTKNETLSLELADRMFKSLSDYYINKAIEKSLKTYKIITNKRDSILGQLRSSEYQLANFDDRNRGLMMRTDAVGRIRLQRDVTALTVMYGEVLKNVEVADFSLRSKTPFIQVIDSPIPPIAPVVLSLLRKLLIGIVIGGFIGTLIVVVRKFFRELMTENS